MARIRSVAEAEERLASLREQERQVKEQLRAMRAREKAKERKQRNHELMVIGGMVAQCFDGIEDIDLGALQSYLNRYRAAIRSMAGGAGHADIGEAYAACREFEAARREAKRTEEDETRRLVERAADPMAYDPWANY